MSKTYEAVLVRGTTYYLGNKRFERGKPVLVTEEEFEKLKTSGVDLATVQHGSDDKTVMELQKFRFKEVGGKAVSSKDRTNKLLALADAESDVDFVDEDELEDEEIDEDDADESDADISDQEDDDTDEERPAVSKKKTKSAPAKPARGRARR